MTDFTLVNGLAIDSTKVRIPLSLVQITDTILNKPVTTIVNESGEVVSESKVNKLLDVMDGAKIEYRIQHLEKGNEGRPDVYLVFGIHSKMLPPDRYLEGLTSDNIILVYQWLMKLGKFKFDLDTFLNARCTDLDIKQDFIAPTQLVYDQLTWLSQSFKRPINSKNTGVYVNKTKSGEYTGHSFNERTSSLPYLKFYQKNIESQKDLEYYSKRSEPLPQSLWRSEFTVKNKKHLAKFKIHNSIRSIMAINQLQLDQIRQSTIQTLFTPIMTKKRSKSDLPPGDQVLLFLMMYISEKTGTTSDQLITLASSYLNLPDVNSGKSARCHWKKKLSDLWQKHNDRPDVIKLDQERTKFLSGLGFGILSQIDQEKLSEF